MAATQQPLKEGLLQKLSFRAGLRGWQLRSFRLYSTKLVYSDPNGWKPQDAQIILLEQIKSVYVSEPSHQFEIDTGVRIYKLKSGSDTDAQSWVQAIKDARIVPESENLENGYLSQVAVDGSRRGPTYGQTRIRIEEDVANLAQFDSSPDSWRRKCRVICTMGPSCWDVDKLVKLIDAGMNIARLNFSHGDHASHGSTVQRIRAAAMQRPEKRVAVLLDTKGPEIRTGFFKEDVGNTIDLQQGQELKLVIDYSFKGDNTCIAISYDKLCKSVRVGGIILCADGTLSLSVKSVGDDHVITEVMNNCKLGERKNCNLPGVQVDLPVLQEKDIADLRDFGVPQNVDFVAASFVQSADDVRMIREVLGEEGKSIKIISKIENEAGLRNFDEILSETDGIMVARGDLGMEIPSESVFLAQKMMIGKCNLRGKVVVTATQMLESMLKSPRPTRAEASDVANAVLDGTDCVMLSGETANGDFPVEAVTIMRRICQKAEAAIDYDSLYSSTRLGVQASQGTVSAMEATCSSAVKTVMETRSKLLITVTHTGDSARMLAKYRPSAPIIAVAGDDQACRQLQCLRNVVALYGIQSTLQHKDTAIQHAVEHAKKEQMVNGGDGIIAVYGQAGNETSRKSLAPNWSVSHSNFISLLTVPGGIEDEDDTSQTRDAPRRRGASYGQCRICVDTDVSVLAQFDTSPDSFNRKCRIICTMGPACWDVDNLVKLMDAGMNIARLNFSHGDHEGHGETVQRIRKAQLLRPDKHIGILLDTKGPEIRTGFFRDDVGKTIDLVQGQDLKLVVDYEFKGDSTCIALSYSKLCHSVKVGGIILCADGSLSLQVKSVGDDHVMTEVMNNCKLGERKNCNLPGVHVDLPVLQEKDIDDLRNFGLPQKVDFVAASFVQSAADVKSIREVLGDEGKDIKIISKIENEAGLRNFDEILNETDGIMVARGDLGMEIPPESVFLAQKMMIGKCNMRGKPVVTATQMLESMLKNPRPTRAEASDVANAVLDGTDCVMLSGETANGYFPEAAVTIMRRICEKAEGATEYDSLYLSTRLAVQASVGVVDSMEAICSSAVKTAIDSGSTLLISVTDSGNSALMLAKYRPRVPILAISGDERVCRLLQLSRGIVVLCSPESRLDTDVAITKAIDYAKSQSMVKTGDSVIAVHGQHENSKDQSDQAAKSRARKSLFVKSTVGQSNLLKMLVVP